MRDSKLEGWEKIGEACAGMSKRVRRAEEEPIRQIRLECWEKAGEANAGMFRGWGEERP